MRVALRPATDAPRVKEIIIPHLTISDTKPEVRYIAAFNKERTFFIEKSLISREVHFRRICLNLSEVGINSQVHGQIVCDTYLGIDNAIESRSLSGCFERVTRI